MKNALVVGIILLFSACSPTPKGTTYWVNSYKVDCVGVGPMKCMLIQKSETIVEGEWQNFYSQIEGFEYEPGFIYKLLVQEEEKENVPSDASSINYTLLEVLEKKKDTKRMLNGAWDAFKIEGSVIKLPKIPGAGAIPQLTFDITKMQLSGIDGCNRIHGHIEKIKGENIEFGPLAVTNMMCPDMTIADAFNKAMGKVKTYEVNTNKLSFLDENGSEVLEFNKAPDPKMLLNDIWVAEQIEGEVIMDGTTAPTLEIHVSKMEVMGSDACNNFMGKITKIGEEELVFGPLAGTRKMCPDMAIPDKFNQAMHKVRKYKVANLKLTLMDENGKLLLVLKKVD